MLQVAMIWHGQIIAYRLLPRRRKITVGPSKRATFVTPALEGRSKFLLLQPRRDGYVLHLAPALKGELNIGGVATPVAEVTSSEVDFARGDKAKLVFADGSDLRVEIRWVDPPEVVPSPRFRDPHMVQITVGTAIVFGVIAAMLNFMWEKTEPKPPLALNPDRVAKIEAPAALEFEKKEVIKREKAGKLGRAAATQKDTIIPKGKEDILREKVQRVGILSIIGRDKAPGSGLSKLFAQSNDVEQAMAGMAGAKMVVGHGAGGLTTSGSGPGGGGTGYGHIYGAGNLDTGGRGTHGHGRGPKLAERGE